MRNSEKRFDERKTMFAKTEWPTLILYEYTRTQSASCVSCSAVLLFTLPSIYVPIYCVEKETHKLMKEKKKDFRSRVRQKLRPRHENKSVFVTKESHVSWLPSAMIVASMCIKKAMLFVLGVTIWLLAILVKDMTIVVKSYTDITFP